MWPGHADAELRRRFEEGRAQSRIPFGAGPALFCGARLRNGGACRQPKLRGHNRCLGHAGPKAAIAFRERQLRDLIDGRISADQWNRSEAKRARNRIRNQWRRDPWTPGSTIDLGVHEDEFRMMMAAGGYAVDDLAPDTVDASRWKFRRFRLDGNREGKWQEYLSLDLPRRAAMAGPRPTDPSPTSRDVSVEPSKALSPGPYSRRRRPDRPKNAKAAGARGRRPPGRPRRAPVIELEAETIARLVAKHPVLRSALALCRNEGEQQMTVAAFARVIADPSDGPATVVWHRALASLRKA